MGFGGVELEALEVELGEEEGVDGARVGIIGFWFEVRVLLVAVLLLALVLFRWLRCLGSLAFGLALAGLSERLVFPVMGFFFVFVDVFIWGFLFFCSFFFFLGRGWLIFGLVSYGAA